jgi:stress response protein YsnF
VRAEHIQVEKQAVIYERVVVRRHEIDQLDHIEAGVRKQVLSVKVDGHVEGSQALYTEQSGEA